MGGGSGGGHTVGVNIKFPYRGKDGGLKEVNFERILDIFKVANRRIRFNKCYLPTLYLAE